MRSRYATSVLLLAVLFFLTGQAAIADKHIVEEVTVRASSEGGEGAGRGRTAEVHTWFGAQRYVRIDGLNNTTTIVRKDLGKIYLVRHAEKTVVEFDMPFAMPDQLRPLFGDVRMGWQLTRHSETRTIRDLACRKVVLRGSGVVAVEIEMWVTSEAGVDTTILYPLVAEALRPSPLYAGLADQLLSLGKVFSLQTVTTMTKTGLSSTRTAVVKSITDEPTQSSIYKPPDDYTKEMFGFKAYLALVRDQSAF